jgi:CO/xanthine dehydrogenase Mo-binding subunit
MGLGLSMSEETVFSSDSKPETTSFRTFKTLRVSEAPEYLVEFLETPQTDAPFGARGLGEHGIIGIPAALANAVSIAAEIDINTLPVTPEYIWRKVSGGKEKVSGKKKVSEGKKNISGKKNIGGMKHDSF